MSRTSSESIVMPQSETNRSISPLRAVCSIRFVLNPLNSRSSTS